MASDSSVFALTISLGDGTDYRHSVTEARLRKFAPLPETHPAVGKECPACKKPIKAGDVTTLVPLGPGESDEDRQKARDGRPYTASAALVHWACATGEV